jgi:CBS domain-containing protein
LDPEKAPGTDVDLREIMHPEVSVTPDTPAREALKVMIRRNLPGVPVVEEDNTLVGFVTDGDLLASALPKYLTMIEDLSFVSERGDTWVHYLTEAADRPVGEVMSRKVAHTELGTSELEAARKMVAEGVSSVVVTEKGKMVGIVNRKDLYAAIIGLERDQDPE